MVNAALYHKEQEDSQQSWGLPAEAPSYVPIYVMLKICNMEKFE